MPESLEEFLIDAENSSKNIFEKKDSEDKITKNDGEYLPDPDIDRLFYKDGSDDETSGLSYLYSLWK